MFNELLQVIGGFTLFFLFILFISSIINFIKLVYKLEEDIEMLDKNRAYKYEIKNLENEIVLLDNQKENKKDVRTKTRK